MIITNKNHYYGYYKNNYGKALFTFICAIIKLVIKNKNTEKEPQQINKNIIAYYGLYIFMIFMFVIYYEKKFYNVKKYYID
jgi:hypothetical protein